MQNHQATSRPIDGEIVVEPGYSAQQLFQRVRAAEVEPRRETSLGGLVSAIVGALRGPRQTELGAASRTRTGGRSRTTEASRNRAASEAQPRHLAGLESAGCVVLSARRVPLGRRQVDHLVVAPSGVYVVLNRSWRGQVSVTADQLYVDGRPRSGVAEQVTTVAAGVRDLLADELRPQSVPVIPTLCLLNVETRWQSWSVHGVEVVTGRGLARYMRQAAPIMGQESVVRLALSADRLLEHS